MITVYFTGPKACADLTQKSFCWTLQLHPHQQLYLVDLTSVRIFLLHINKHHPVKNNDFSCFNYKCINELQMNLKNYYLLLLSVFYLCPNLLIVHIITCIQLHWFLIIISSHWRHLLPLPLLAYMQFSKWEKHYFLYSFTTGLAQQHGR